MVASAIRSGVLMRPLVCQCRNCVLHPDQHCHHAYPRYKIEAHHHDYTRPLDVDWLCNPCHKIADERTQMTPKVIAKALAMRGQGLSLAYVARQLGVSIRTLRPHVMGTKPRTYISK